MVAAGGGRERIVIAMSGGVDSSTAAACWSTPATRSSASTLRLYDASGTAASIGGRCCGPRDIEDARATAAHLGIPHHVIDESAAFSAAVIDDFVAEYRAGRTPNPCVRCNERIKFGPLLAFVDAVGASALATGHYARLEPDGAGAGVALGRARDADKDQSYFLFGVRPEILARVRFPLGDKTQGRGARAGAPVRSPQRRQGRLAEICFIPDGDHVGFPRRAAAAAGRPARSSTTQTGVALGAHAGTHALHDRPAARVARRRTERRFVLRIDGATGEVRVGPRDRLGRDRLRVSDVRWLDPRAADAAPCAARCRSAITRWRAPAWIEPSGDGATLVRLDEPAFGVAPGQAAVFYDSDDRVLGGGWIVARR